MKYYKGHIPVCGIFCGGCPVYVRDKNRAETNVQRCEGCKSYHLCCKEKGITHCCYCPKYPCARLKAFAKRWLKYGQNIIDNQNLIKEMGANAFLVHMNKKVYDFLKPKNAQ